MSIPPEPVTGFCILPRAPTISRTAARTAVAVAAAGLGELPEGRGVEVQSLYRDAHLVGPDRGVGVQPLRRLGQHAGRLEHPVHPECPF